MLSSTGSVAAALAVLPSRGDAPRVVRQFTSVFLVGRTGEIWRVYDAENPDAIERHMPSEASGFRCRVFVALARNAQVRVFTFDPAVPHAVDPSSLQAQLDDAAVSA